MAYTANTLALVFGGGGGRAKIWHYLTADSQATVNTSGYFDDKAGEMDIGDVIFVTVVDAVDPATRAAVTDTFIMSVVSNTGTVVDVSDGMPTLRAGDANKVFLPFFIDQVDLLAANTAELVCPIAGNITALYTTIHIAITTGGVITVEVATVAVDGLSITIADSDAKGDLQSDTPTTGHATTVVAVGDRIEIVPSAAFATAGAVNGFLEITGASDSD